MTVDGAAMNVADVRTRPHARPSLRVPMLWGFVFGVIQAASPLGFAWLEPATVHALVLCFIAAVYVGFAVADGRPRVIVIECLVAAVFVVLASVSVTGNRLAARRRIRRTRRQGLLARTPPLRRQHPLVATVLRMRRLGRRARPHRRDRSRGQLPHLGLAPHKELA